MTILREIFLISLIGFGHFTVDFYMGFFPPLLPHLSDLYGLNLTEAGVLVGAAASASSLTQPVFGAVTDRIRSPWLLPAAALLTTCVVSMVSRAQSYLLLMLLAAGGGIGSALYHPFGAAVATRLVRTPNRRATAVSIYSAFGSFGAAMSPLVAVFVLLTWGLDGFFYAGSLGALLVCLMIAFRKRWLFAARDDGAGSGAGAGEKHEGATGTPHPSDMSDVGGSTAAGGSVLFRASFPLVLLILMLFLRSWAQHAVMSFVSFWFEGLGMGEKGYGLGLSLFLMSGVAGGLICGAFGDKRNRIKVLVLSGVVSAVALAMFLRTSGAMSFVYLSLAGAGMNGALPISVVLAQEMLPRNTGLASGMTLGFTWGLSGLATALTGLIGDFYGLGAALWSLVPVLVISIPIPLFLPLSRRQEKAVGTG